MDTVATIVVNLWEFIPWVAPYLWQLLLVLLGAWIISGRLQRQQEGRAAEAQSKEASRIALLEIYHSVVEYNNAGYRIEQLSDPGRSLSQEDRLEKRDIHERTRRLAKLVALKAYEVTDTTYHELIATLILGMQNRKSMNYSLPDLALIGCTEDLAKAINKPLIDAVSRLQIADR